MCFGHVDVERLKTVTLVTLEKLVSFAVSTPRIINW